MVNDVSEIRALNRQWHIKRGEPFCSSVTRIVRKRAFCHPIESGMCHLRRKKTTLRDDSVASWSRGSELRRNIAKATQRDEKKILEENNVSF